MLLCLQIPTGLTIPASKSLQSVLHFVNGQCAVRISNASSDTASYSVTSHEDTQDSDSTTWKVSRWPRLTWKVWQSTLLHFQLQKKLPAVPSIKVGFGLGKWSWQIQWYDPGVFHPHIVRSKELQSSLPWAYMVRVAAMSASHIEVQDVSLTCKTKVTIAAMSRCGTQLPVTLSSTLWTFCSVLRIICATLNSFGSCTTIWALDSSLATG